MMINNEIMKIKYHMNSYVFIHTQIDQLGKRIAEDNFVEKMGIQLVAHSPLQRARQTSYGKENTI